MKNLKRNKKGFTLVELIIVIAIIGILAAVLVPTMIGVVNKANASKAGQELINLQSFLTEPLAKGGGVTTQAELIKEIAADESAAAILLKSGDTTALNDAENKVVIFQYVAANTTDVEISIAHAKKNVSIYFFRGEENAITGWIGAVKFVNDQNAGKELKKDTYGVAGTIDSINIKVAVA